jgi:hypothetical protein
MGMYDTVVVEETFVFMGKTFKDFQTKGLDCYYPTLYELLIHQCKLQLLNKENI